MPLNQSFIPNLSEEFTELASELDIRILEELRKVTNRIVQDPDLDFEKRITDKAEDDARNWYEKSVKWIEQYMAIAYLRGLNMQDRELESMGADKNEGNPVPRPRFDRFAVIGGTISTVAKEILKDFPSHWDSYRWYENTFKESVNRVRLPFRRSTVQHYRDIAALAQKETFRSGATATRRDLAQDIIDEFAGRGINVIQFPSQHKMSIEAFAHRESRAYLQHVAVQGQINRATERGYDLVRINSYAGASPMCAPHQGKVYSLSGNSDHYPPFSDALFDGTYNYGSGIYHDFCGHFQSTYIPGLSEAVPITDDPLEQSILEEMGEAEGNRFIYEARQQQRDIEYTLRQLKRKKVTSLDSRDAQRINESIKYYQAKMRGLMDEFKFLKRDYTKENL